MTRTKKVGYIGKGWWNPITNRYVPNEFAVIITKITESDEFGKWEEIDEDEIKRYGGFETEAEAEEFLKKEMRVKEIHKEDI